METPRSKVNSNLLKILSIRNYEGSDIEQKALELYQCLSSVSKNDEKYIYIYLKITNSKRSPENSRVRMTRNFKIILLSSLRHLKLYNKDENFPMEAWMQVITRDLLCSIDHLDFRTLYLFKVIDQVVLKKLDHNDEILEQILNKLYEVCYVSPLANLKNYAVSIIHKIELKIGKVLKTFDPLQNIGLLTNYDETRIKLEQIKSETIHSNLRQYMEFIHRYFHFNVYNKSAGIVYKAVISRYDTENFRTHIWPFWCKSFDEHSNSREFRQSFLKYWIPISVQKYKTDLYIFLRKQNISPILLVEILYELRRKRYVTIENLSRGFYNEDLMSFLDSYETNEKAFEIICTFPSLSEEITVKYLEIFEDYCLNHKIPNSCSERLLSQFLTHIFVSEHARMQKSTSEQRICDSFIKKLNNFTISSLIQEKNLDLSVILCKIFACMKKPSKDLKNMYELPKKYEYGPGENKYLLHVERKEILNIFTLKKQFVTSKLLKIFNSCKRSDESITWLLKNTFADFETEDLKQTELEKSKNCISLLDLEKYMNCQMLRLYKTSKEREKIELHLSFNMIEHKTVLVLSIVKINNDGTEEMFDLLKIMNVLFAAIEMKIIEECQSSTVISMLNFMVDILEENKHEGLSIKNRKILEHLFCRILDILNLSPTTLRNYSNIILSILVVLIEKSNMRKVVTESLNLVPTLVKIMMSSDSKTQNSLEKFYMDLLNTIVSITNSKQLSKSRMRKHPRLRALLHAVCKGSGSKQREYVSQAMKKMIWKLMQHNLQPTVHTVLLECLEILLLEPNFYNYTAVYLEEIIKLSLNSFQSNNWSVKNATIQLTNTIITRVFGVQQTENIRLRSFQEFSVLFPKLSDHFFEILSSTSLDDRAVIVLQYLSASEVQIYDHSNADAKKKIQDFLALLEKLLESKQDYVIKFVPHAIVNLNTRPNYSKHMNRVFKFVLKNIHEKPVNVVVNHLILFKEFVKRINENYTFLKPMEVGIDNSIVNVVNDMNDFLKNKNLQYLDLYNIRHYVLEQNLSNDNNINLDVSLKRWNFCNLIFNFPHGFISRNFWKLYDLLYENSDLNFLLDTFFERIISYAIEEKDSDLISRIFKVLSVGIFCSKNDKKLCRIFAESILILKDFVGILTFEDIEIGNMKNMNFYEAILIQIILTKKNCQNKSKLCTESFKKLSEFSQIENFGLDLLPKTLSFMYENLKFLDEYSFLEFLFCLAVSDCDKEVFCMFLTQFCKKCVNEDNCVLSLLNNEFLLEYFKDADTVRKFLVNSLKLLENFERKVSFETFYTDTYHSLQIYKDFINKTMSTFYDFFFIIHLRLVKGSF